MGRWVTSKGRRIYIPDEGEENPFAEKRDDKYEVSKGMIKENLETIQRKKEALARAEQAGDKLAATGFRQDIESLKKQNSSAHGVIKDQINKEESIKQRQIVTNKKQADKRNGKKKRKGK